MEEFQGQILYFKWNCENSINVVVVFFFVTRSRVRVGELKKERESVDDKTYVY